MVTCGKDILEDIYREISKEIPQPKQISLFNMPNLSKNEEIIYNKLSLTPTNIETLTENINLTVAEINSTLTMLELNGYIKSLPGKQYVINVE